MGDGALRATPPGICPRFRRDGRDLEPLIGEDWPNKLDAARATKQGEIDRPLVLGRLLRRGSSPPLYQVQETTVPKTPSSCSPTPRCCCVPG